MSFPRYPEYKPSGVEWLGEVPKGWGCVPTKAVATHNDEAIDEATPADEEIEYVEISDVEAGSGITGSARLPFGEAPSRARRKVRHGDIAVSTVRTYLRAISPIRHPPANLILSTGFAVLRPHSIDSAYLGYVVESPYFVDSVIAKSVGVSYPAINASDLVGIQVPIPTLAEQTAIAAFLDRETAKIDALVAEQQKLIALLKEKRQAVISHAVTKGLNPDAPMKPSGIEWLGDVPAHWEVRALRTLCSVVRGASPRPAGDPEFFGGDHIPWVTVAEITKDEIKQLVCVDEYLTEAGMDRSRVFKSGTVIYSNSGATLGVPKVLGFDACANDGVVGFERLDSAMSPDFLYQFLAALTPIIRDEVKQGSGQPNLNTDIVKAIRIALPPLHEQSDVCCFIEAAAKHFHALTLDTETAITLLKERRSALISAAVTGQIDVRNFVDSIAMPDAEAADFRDNRLPPVDLS